MSTTAAVIKRGDLLPALVVQLTDGGSAWNGAGYTVQARGRDQTGALVIDAAMSAVDEAAGKYAYAWQAGDTATAGGLDLEFEATHTATGKIRTFPDEGFIFVTITEDI